MRPDRQGGKIDLGVALPLNIGSGGTLITDLPRSAAEEVIWNGITVEIEVQMRLVCCADREILTTSVTVTGPLGSVALFAGLLIVKIGATLGGTFGLGVPGVTPVGGICGVA